MESVEETYTSANIILRSARVVIVFRADDHWQAWARLAISVAGKYWGGAGFILAPCGDDGTIAPEIISVVQAYDPDHVVTMRLPLAEWERVAPGLVPIRLNGKLLVGDERRAYLAEGLNLPQPDHLAMRARTALAAACTPLRRSHSGDDAGRESLEILNFEAEMRGGLLIPAERGTLDSVVLAGSELWEGDAALSLAIRTGILPAALEGKTPDQRAEPDTAQMLQTALDPARWSRDGHSHLAAPMNAGGTSPGMKPRFWFDEPEGGLTPVRSGVGRDGGAIVVGDSAEDFALAYAYERLLSFGVWLTPAMLMDGTLSPRLQSSVEYAAHAINGRAERLTISSASLNEEDLTELIKAFETDAHQTTPFTKPGSTEQDKSTSLPDGLQVAPPDLKTGLWQLAVADPFVTEISVPVSIEPDGTATMRSPLASPMPAKPLRRSEFPRPYWYVSADLYDMSMPKGRGVPQEFVQPDPGRDLFNGVRSGRDGFAFHSQSGGSLVMAGSPLSSQLHKPRLKALGMQSWVQAMARRAEMEARPSLPGMHARLLARLLGGRQGLTSIVSSAFHPALRLFATHEDKNVRTDAVFPRKDGVVLLGEPYPRFDALFNALDGGTQEDLRGWIDRLAAADLLRRGFVLGCVDCARPSFVGLDQAGQRYQCVKCSAVNEFEAARWNADGNEPPLFYDLHPAFREIMAKNGDVGLFAAQHLRRQGRGYADTAEMQFHKAGAGNPFAEIDLVAHVSGEVVVVEAKSNGSLGSSTSEARRAAQKKIDVAIALRADKVVVATTAPSLVGSAVEILKEVAQSNGVRKLCIEELVNLGPDRFESEMIESEQTPR